MQASFELIPPYARIFAARGDADSGIDRRLYPIYYAPTLAAYERHAFVPQLYALPGVQPLSGAASVSRLMIRYANEHRLVSISFLQKIADGHIDDNDPPYLRTWTADYDYLYLTGPHTPNPLPDLLTEMMTAARFTLYKTGTTARTSNAQRSCCQQVRT
jgi:hypothetical protein